jgi:hypothetical protein
MIFLLFLEELHEAFRSIGIFNEQMNTIDVLPNEIDLPGFLHLFSSNIKTDISSQSISVSDKAFEH